MSIANGSGRTCRACGNSTGAGPCRVCAHDPATAATRTPDQLDRFAAGEIDAGELACVLCCHRPCACPPFGTDAYLALVAHRHGQR